MRKILLMYIVLINLHAKADNLLGGEITCRNINGLMYETTLTIYRDTITGNLPLNYTITYRDSVDTVFASNIVITPPSVSWYNGFRSFTYIDTIIFPFAGLYKASAWSCCRDSVGNIPNSTSYGMYLECKVLADGVNSSPKFLSSPIIFAQLNQPFTNNITPYDADGDSISWELVIPEDVVSNGSGGFSIVTLPYNYPPSDSSLPFHIDPILGDISFKPNVVGKYQIAVKITEWKNGVQIGHVLREIELNVGQINNTPLAVQTEITVVTNNLISWQHLWTTNLPHPDIFISPGDNLFIHQIISDPDLIGYPYSQCFSASILNSNAGISSGPTYNDWHDCEYIWGPISTSDVTSQPYLVTFRNFETYFLPYVDYLLSDCTFRIFVSPNTTGLNEIGNETKSVYLKSIDILGRETDPNLPGFRIDLYSDGKTKKVFRGE